MSRIEMYTCDVCGQTRRGQRQAKPPKWCRRCFESLAETRRSIIEGCWWDGWLNREIAEVLGRSSYKAIGPDMDRLRRDGRIGKRTP